MSGNFEYMDRRGNERLERDPSGNVLKKYGGTGTSWPSHSKVQMYGESHKQQQRNLLDAQRNITDFMKKF